MLTHKFTQKEMDRVLSVMPEVMTVWKASLNNDGHGHVIAEWSAATTTTNYKPGLHVTDLPGFHFLCKKHHACNWISGIIARSIPYKFAPDAKVIVETTNFISCLIRRDKIVAMGHEDTGHLCVVVSEAIFPKYPTKNVWESIERAEIVLPDEYQTQAAPDVASVLEDNKMESLLMV
jgi:hypothetical protein